MKTQHKFALLQTSKDLDFFNLCDQCHVHLAVEDKKKAQEKKLDMTSINMINFDRQECNKYIYLVSFDRQKYKK